MQAALHTAAGLVAAIVLIVIGQYLYLGLTVDWHAAARAAHQKARQKASGARPPLEHPDGADNAGLGGEIGDEFGGYLGGNLGGGQSGRELSELGTMSPATGTRAPVVREDGIGLAAADSAKAYDRL